MTEPRFGCLAPIFASPGFIAVRTPSSMELTRHPILGTVREAEQLGLESVWVADRL